MPVLVLASAEDLDIVRPLVLQLLEGGGEVRCYLDDDDHVIRNMGCKLATGALDDEANLEGALTNIHTFIPLLTDPARMNGAEALHSYLNLAEGCARAASAAGIGRTILPLWAASGFKNPLGAAIARAEQAFRDLVQPLAVIHAGLLWGPERPFPRIARALSADSSVSANGVSVLQLEDFVAFLAAADDREDLDGVWELPAESRSLQNLAQLAGHAEPAEPGPWLREIIANGYGGAASADRIFGVVAGGLRSLHDSQPTGA